MANATASTVKQACSCTAHLGSCAYCVGLTRRALAIADVAMFELMNAECIPHDEYRTVLGFSGENGQEVASLAEASEAMQEAMAWLLERGYVELSEDPSGQYIDVVRRPGEDDDVQV